ncbi:unnamed protein product [Cylindrotheca closterium]|uniref:chorismate mutase n=1 Tax=Cylindrotheca closterium TaxID=2856 RepID=A0AAD2JN56_9STRA|nr:unnamed protein product [Cylindrotheca closterium]
MRPLSNCKPIPSVCLTLLLIAASSFNTCPCEALASSPSSSQPPRSTYSPFSWRGNSAISTSSLQATNVNTDATTSSTATSDEDQVKTTDVLSLDSIRDSLIRLEETIIFALIERAQYRQNQVVYMKKHDLVTPPGSVVPEGLEDEPLSLLEYLLIGTETLHYAVRRYTSPEENAFFPDRLPNEKIMEELEYPTLLSDVGAAIDVNFNEILMKKYLEIVVPSIARAGDDEQHGSTVLCDVAVLQALSKRVHYGKFVAESKYMCDPEGYQRLVDAGDADGVMELLTNSVVEAKVLRRARLKAATYGREPLLADMQVMETSKDHINSILAAAAAAAVVGAMEALGADPDGNNSGKICPSTVESVYRDIIIPLTKDIEVAYLFLRCGKDPPPQFAPDRMSTDEV